MATGYLLPISTILQFFTDQGVVLSGGKVYTYVAGTTTPVATYTSSSLSVLQANPIILQSNGRLGSPVWVPAGVTVKMVLQDSSGNIISGGTIDNLQGINDPSYLTQAAIGLALYPQTAAEISAGVTPTNYAYPVGNVLRYGAVADYNWSTGIGTDNASVFNSAIKAIKYSGGGVLTVPVGAFRIASALNFCGTGSYPYDFGNCPIIVQGQGMGIDFAPGNNAYGGSWVVGQTGNWIADCTGAQYVKFNDIGFRGTGTGMSQSGILCARSTAVTFAQNIGFKNVTIWVDTYPTANGNNGRGSIALANNGAEQMVVEHCWLISDTPYAATYYNSTDLAFTSVYTTISNTPATTTLCNYRNVVFQAITKQALYLQGVQNHTFDTCIWTVYGGSNTTNYGIELISGNSGTQHCQTLRFSGQIENFPGAVTIQDAHIWNVTTNFMMPNPTLPYISGGAVIMENCVWNVQHLNGSSGQYAMTFTSASTMSGGEIWLYSGDTSPTANTNLGTTGTLIKGGNIDLSGALGFTAGSSYVALGAKGITVQQAGLSINSSLQTPTNGFSIPVTAGSLVRCNPASSVTGLVMGGYGTLPGQQLTIVNESSLYSMTFAVVGTSFVADGTSCVIAANRKMDFVYDASAGLWYHS